MDVHAVRPHVLHVLEDATALLAELHDGTHIVRRRKDMGLRDGLLRALNDSRIREVAGVRDFLHGAVCQVDLVDNTRHSRDEVEIVLPLQPLLDDLHMEKAQETAAETESESGRGLRLKGERCVVELQLFQRLFQVFIVRTVCGVHATEHHRVDLAVARKGLCSGVRGKCDRVADTGLRDGFDGGHDIADLAGPQTVPLFERGSPHVSKFHDLKFGAGCHHANGIPTAQAAVYDADIDDDAPVAVVDGVKDKGAKRRILVSLGRWNVVNNLLQYLFHILTGLGGDPRCILTVEADYVLHLFGHPVRVGRREIDLIDDRDDFQVMVQGEIGIGKRLRLYSLSGVNDENSPVTGSEGTRDLIVEVHMAGGVYEIQFIDLSVICMVVQFDGAGLDGDAALALNVHVVEDLLLHVMLGDRVRELQKPVGQGRFSVVNVGNDGEIPDVLLVVCHAFSSVLYA